GPAAGDRTGGCPGPAADAAGDGWQAGATAAAADGWGARSPDATADAPQLHRLEPRSAQPRGAGTVPAPGDLRGRLHTGGGRDGLQPRRRPRAGCPGRGDVAGCPEPTPSGGRP